MYIDHVGINTNDMEANRLDSVGALTAQTCSNLRRI
jgi:hypothetical protein